MYTHATDAGWISRSHRAIAPFGLEKPDSIDAAVAALARPGSVAIAGGIDLIRRMRAGDRPETLVDISHIPGLSGVAEQDDHIRIGATTTHWDIETDRLLSDRLPAFQTAWKTIGNVRVRMAGTVGGNLMAAERGYDGLVLLGALGSRLEFATPAGLHTVDANDFADGSAPVGGLLTAVLIPARDRARLSFNRSLKPVVSVAVSVTNATVRVGVGCAFAAPIFRSADVGDIDAAFGEKFCAPLDTPMGSAGYRRRMIGVLACRQVRLLLGKER